MPNYHIKKARILIILVLFSFLLVVESTRPNRSRRLRRHVSNGGHHKASYRLPIVRPPKPLQPIQPLQNNAYGLEKEFLDAHNEIRLQNGEPLFTWEPKLALYAKQHALQHHVDCGMVHSTGPYGENLFLGIGGGVRTPMYAVQRWANEFKYYNRASNTCQGGQMCGHYTQIVWRDSTRLGCARNVCKNGNTYIVCEYDPPGNYVNERPFDKHV